MPDVPDSLRQGPVGEVLRPYDPPLSEGVLAHVQMVRSAKVWRADTEALLAEQEMPVELAETVESLVDTFGMSIRSAIGQIKAVLAAEG